MITNNQNQPSVSQSYNHQESSIMVGRNGKGTYSWEIKIYFGNNIKTEDEAIQKIASIDEKLQVQFEGKATTTTHTSVTAPQTKENEISKTQEEIPTHNGNGKITTKQLNLIMMRIRQRYGLKDSEKQERKAIELAVENQICDANTSLGSFSITQASSLIDTLE